MSLSEDRLLAQRWLQTAEDDLKAANTLMEAGLAAHACFAAQAVRGKGREGLVVPGRGRDVHHVSDPKQSPIRSVMHFGTASEQKKGLPHTNGQPFSLFKRLFL